MTIRSLILVVAIAVLSACGTSKKAANTASATAVTKDIIQSHENAAPTFTTLASRVQVVYQDEKKQQSIVASLRMEKDKIIWIKASFLGITLAKVLITPNEVKYYESITGTYFDGDFALLSDVLGTEIDFEKAQNILLGQSIFSLSPSAYDASALLNTFKLLPKRQHQDYIHSIVLNAENFKVHNEIISQPDENRLLTVRYSDYQTVDGTAYPSEIEIDATENDSKTKIHLTYKKIDLNVSLSYPFTIPDGYEEIQL